MDQEFIPLKNTVEQRVTDQVTRDVTAGDQDMSISADLYARDEEEEEFVKDLDNNLQAPLQDTVLGM